jgi:flavin-dependent dehydrogenase
MEKVGVPPRETVNIIGAGPAGLTAAIVLLRHRVPVRVFEKGPEAGHRLSGDFQGLENWSSEKDITDIIKDIGLEINFPCVPYYSGTVFTRGMSPAVIKSRRPVFYLVRRGPAPGTLDTCLKEQALSLGAEIVFNRRVEGMDGNAIVATGPRGADIVAAGITFETTAEDTAAVALDDRLAPKGYAYLLANQGLATMATVLFRDYRKGSECLEKTRKFFEENTGVDIRGERKFVRFGNFFMRDTQVINGKLFTGESAGFQDCLWGFGMRYALLSGYLAAKSIIEGSHYDALWKSELGPVLKASLINRYLFEKFRHPGYRHLTRKFTRGNPCAYLLKHYNLSTWKSLLLPLAARSYKSRARHKPPDMKTT